MNLVLVLFYLPGPCTELHLNRFYFSFWNRVSVNSKAGLRLAVLHSFCLSLQGDGIIGLRYHAQPFVFQREKTKVEDNRLSEMFVHEKGVMCIQRVVSPEAQRIRKANSYLEFGKQASVLGKALCGKTKRGERKDLYLTSLS